MNPDGFTLAGQRKRCSILRCKMVCRFAVPSAFAFAVRAARDAFTRHILWLALRASVNAVQKRFRRFCQTRHELSRHIWTLPHLQSVFFKTAWQVVQSYIRFFAFVATP
ncbi:hypothetical protein Dda3937_04516 [Dickeya dadantii 3937]|uniref:Uncharacterized protein n=1 Tax=Dickeya dadantii (strain 3937) TaxID=198628 RepID=E0SHG0_DICD3|nr:hypothetical protein Dda3937_04516 [Dickeya dadantii 3937]